MSNQNPSQALTKLHLCVATIFPDPLRLLECSLFQVLVFPVGLLALLSMMHGTHRSFMINVRIYERYKNDPFLLILKEQFPICEVLASFSA